MKARHSNCSVWMKQDVCMYACMYVCMHACCFCFITPAHSLTHSPTRSLTHSHQRIGEIQLPHALLQRLRPRDTTHHEQTTSITTTDNHHLGLTSTTSPDGDGDLSLSQLGSFLSESDTGPSLEMLGRGGLGREGGGILFHPLPPHNS